MRPLSPWDLARSADGSARDADRDGDGGAGTDDLLAVGGTVVVRASLLLALAGLVATVVPASGAAVLAVAGTLGPLAYAGLYLRASTPAARAVLLASLRRGYRTSLALLVVVAAVLVRYAGVRLGWVDQPEPPPAWALAVGAAVVAGVQTDALRRRARRGPA